MGIIIKNGFTICVTNFSTPTPAPTGTLVPTPTSTPLPPTGTLPPPPTNTPTQTNTPTPTSTPVPPTGTLPPPPTNTPTQTNTPTPTFNPPNCTCWSFENTGIGVANVSYDDCISGPSSINIDFGSTIYKCVTYGETPIQNSGTVDMVPSLIPCDNQSDCEPTITPTQTNTPTNTSTPTSTPTSTEVVESCVLFSGCGLSISQCSCTGGDLISIYYKGVTEGDYNLPAIGGKFYRTLSNCQNNIDDWNNFYPHYFYLQKFEVSSNGTIINKVGCT